MINPTIAASLKRGDILHHVSKTNADGTPVRVRVTGKVKFWKTRPYDFKIPVKHGLYDTGYIDNCFNRNASEWSLP